MGRVPARRRPVRPRRSRGAESDFAAALALLPGYHRALAGLAQVRAAQRRDDQAVELYRRALATIPLPEYAAALGDVYTRMGRAPDARRQYDLVQYVARLDAARPALYNRELVYFYADHGIELGRALELARQEVARASSGPTTRWRGRSCRSAAPRTRVPRWTAPSRSEHGTPASTSTPA